MMAEQSRGVWVAVSQPAPRLTTAPRERGCPVASPSTSALAPAARHRPPTGTAPPQLDNPNLHDPAQREAYALLKENPAGYKAKVRGKQGGPVEGAEMAARKGGLPRPRVCRGRLAMPHPPRPSSPRRARRRRSRSSRRRTHGTCRCT
jgi:hypothetical protein